MRKKLKGNSITFLMILVSLLLSCKGKRETENEIGVKDLYTCPMKEDSVFSDKPGTCPKCGMDLVKTENHVHYHPHDSQQTTMVYTCPMHPEIIRDKAGQCPICGMDLVQKIENSNVSMSAVGVNIQSVNESGLESLVTIKPEFKTLPIVIESFGYISYDPKSTYSIASRYSGRIEKLYVKYNFQKVQKGERIMDIYNPEMVAAQQNLLFLLRSDPDNLMLIKSSKEKLRLLGMDDKQISHLLHTKKVEQVIGIYSKENGHLHQMGGHTSDITSFIVKDENGTQEMSSTDADQKFTFREGMYVEKGQTIFNVISTEKMWVILKIFPKDVPFIKTGQTIEMVSEMFPDKVMKDRLGFIEPIFIEGSKYLNARVYLTDPEHQHGKFKIGSFVKAKVYAGEYKGLWIPQHSAIGLGNSEYTVYVKTPQGFKSKKVIMGTRIGNNLEVKEGLSLTDEIVEDVQYLLDSEGFVKINR